MSAGDPIIEEYDLDERDRQLLRAIDGLIQRQIDQAFNHQGKGWDRTYKGDEYWFEFRAHVVNLITRLGAVSYYDISAEPWFELHSHIAKPIQWHWAMQEHPIPGKPPPQDGLQLIQFKVRDGLRGSTYLTRLDWLQGAIIETCKRESLKNPRRVLIRYDAQGGCIRCMPGGEG